MEPSDTTRIRVRPSWLRTRSVVAGALLAVGLVWGVAGWVANGRGYQLAEEFVQILGAESDHRLEQLRACSVNERADWIQFCVPSPAEVRQHAPEYVGFEGLLAQREVAGGAELIAVRESLAEVARAVAREQLARQLELGPGRRGLLLQLGTAIWTLLYFVMIGVLVGPILLIYGIASLIWAARRFHVNLTEGELGIGPPTGVVTHPLGNLRAVQLEAQRLVVEERSGARHRSARLRVSPELTALVRQANLRIAENPLHFGTQVQVKQAPDAVRLNQLAPPWFTQLAGLSVALGALGLLAVGGGTVIASVQLSYMASAFRPPEDQTAAQTCGRGERSPLCRAVEPGALTDVPAPHVLQRWRIQDLTIAWHDHQGVLPPVTALDLEPGSPQAQEWLGALRADPRATGAIWIDGVAVPEAARDEIERRAAAEAAQLQTLFTHAWRSPEIQAEWERLIRRDQQIREGFPTLLIWEFAPPLAALLLLFGAMIVAPPWLVRRLRFQLEVTPTGLRIRKRHIAFADIAEIGIERHRVYVRTRDGRRYASGRLAANQAAEPIVQAVRERQLDAQALEQERAAMDSAAAVIGVTQARRRAGKAEG